MLLGGQTHSFTREEGLEGGTEVPMPLFHAFLSLPKI